MNWLESTNLAMNYIENNLMNEIDYVEVAKIACCSEYHFPRMFAAITGISLSEYIRRRRLSLAAFDLINTDQRVLDIALKYGYDSPDSFSRAFFKLHGVKPSEARSSGTSLKAFPRMSFQITIKGDVEMEYRLEELDFDLIVVGKSEKVHTKNAFKEIPKLWRNAKQSGFTQQLIDLSWEKPKCKVEGVLGICGKEASIKSEDFDYFMGVRYEDEVPEGMTKVTIPACTWAVLPNVVDAWKRLYSEWLPTSGYELADLPCIECFYEPKHKPKHELWVPIKKS